MTGQIVTTLVNGFEQGGTEEVVWKGTSDDGFHVASGIYISRMTAGSAVLSNRMMLIK